MRELLESAGLRLGALSAQGRLFGTVKNHARQAAPAHRLLAALLVRLDRLGPVLRSPFLGRFTTGYVVVARKRARP
ncbi:MAG: hypothetical protein AAB295_12960 [Chloroflexota bacterium]